jgi:hypothetical protein
MNWRRETDDPIGQHHCLAKTLAISTGSGATGEQVAVRSPQGRRGEQLIEDLGMRGFECGQAHIFSTVLQEEDRKTTSNPSPPAAAGFYA